MRFLIVQTAFIGDVILATPLVEKLHSTYPQAKIDFLLRKGNQALLKGHPLINDLLIWDKSGKKYTQLLALIQTIRQNKYDVVFNLQRFGATGLLTWLSGAKEKVGFDKNPFSFGYTKKIKHVVKSGTHEVQRNLRLVQHLCDETFTKPKLYPSASDHGAVEALKKQAYFCIAPTSVWFTKQWPVEKWVTTIQKLPEKHNVYLLGAKADWKSCEAILKKSGRPNVYNLAGRFSLLESAALMRDAKMNFCNDSAPTHMASAMNAPTTVVYCSTVEKFGFGPLAENAKVVETKQPLACRPCGLHGHAKCPEGHFKCAWEIDVNDMLFN